MLLNIFSSSVKKLSNLESKFLNVDTSWKNKFPISTETFRMVINLQKTFLQTRSFFIVSNKKQIIFVLGRPWLWEISCLYSKVLAKPSTRMQNLYQITYIFCNPLWYLLIHPFDTNLLAPRGTLGLQWICRAHLFIQTTCLHCCLPCNYVTGLSP